MKLYVFPTSRMLRRFKENLLSSNQILPKLTTIDEFEKRVLLVPDKKFANDDTRTIFLKEAADFKEFKKLHFEDEFFSFLKNSTYFFRFFEELEKERVSLEELKSADLYAEFFEHIEILSLLKKRYEEILEKNGYFDSITLPSIYKINRNYLKNFNEIVLKLEGFLTNFELDFLDEISKIVNTKIEFIANRYNKKMAEKFEKRFGFKLESGFEYELNISEKSFKILDSLKYNICGKYISFSNRISQVAYVKKKIDEFVKSGVKPENIAIVLPDESFKNYLELFDEINNLNFAMGFDFGRGKFYKVLTLFEEALSVSNVKISYETDRFAINDLILKWKSKEKISYEEFKELIEDFYTFANQEEKEITDEELKDFSFLFPYIKNYPLKKILRLFLNRLKEKKLEDNRGGKITVLGLLESRGIGFEGVIIPDFNEEVVPKPSQKDLFLDSSLRKKANLPTKKDRENLQKYYYFELFRKAKYAALSFVENDIASKSRFLDELNGFKREDFDAKSINSILVNYKENRHLDQEIVLEYDFKKEKISATKLKNFLECPRRYYFKYIKNIKDFDIPSLLPRGNEVGTFLHEALRALYQNKNRYEKLDDIKRDFKSIIYSMIDKKGLYLRLEIDIWLKKLDKFFKNEIDRFENGVKVFETEVDKTADFNDFILYGKIDRIDFYNNSYQIIDYKSGQIKVQKNSDNIKDFQLIFYYLLSRNLGKIEGLYYYDLNSAKLIKEPNLNEKVEKLAEILENLKKEKEINFKKCEDIKFCRFCPYKIICNRV